MPELPIVADEDGTEAEEEICNYCDRSIDECICDEDDYDEDEDEDEDDD